MGVSTDVQGIVIGTMVDTHNFHAYIAAKYWNPFAHDWGGVIARSWPKAAILASPAGFGFKASKIGPSRTAKLTKKSPLEPATTVATVKYVAKGGACAGQMPAIRQFVTAPLGSRP